MKFTFILGTIILFLLIFLVIHDIFINIPQRKLAIIEPCVVTQIYKLLYITDRVLTENNIEYWVECGTLLGAVRHNGLIPWDDDGDLQIWEKDEEKLLKCKDEFLKYNIEIIPAFFGYQLFFKDGKQVGNFVKKYPSIDIFIMKTEKGIVRYKSDKAQNLFKKCTFNIDELYPLENYIFGSFFIKGPNKNCIKRYLDKCYGNDWNTHAYQLYDHEMETAVKKQKRPLMTREPAQPIEFDKNF